MQFFTIGQFALILIIINRVNRKLTKQNGEFKAMDERNTKKNRIIAIILLLPVVITLGAIFIWAPVCDGLLELVSGKTVPMKCHHFQAAVIALSIVIVGIVIEFFRSNNLAAIAIIFTGILMILMTFDFTVGIGVCMNKEMICNATAMWVRLSGTIAIACGIAALTVKNKG